MGIMLKTLRFFPVAAFVCASSLLLAEAAFAADDLDRILGNTENSFTMCMQRCDEQTSLGRMSRRGCVPGCEQTRENFSLRGRSFRSFQRCSEAVERVLLNRTRIIQREQQWCRNNFTHLHHLRGCLDAVNVFYQNVSVESICGRTPARPAATPPVVVAQVPGATPGLVVARGPQPATPMLQDTPKYQTKPSSKKHGKAGVAKAVEKTPAKAATPGKVSASGNGTLKKQPAVNTTGKGLKALSANGTQPKEKDAPFTPPAVNLEGVVPAPTPSAPVKAPAAPVNVPSSALQAPSAVMPEASGAAPALPVQAKKDFAAPAPVDSVVPVASVAPAPVATSEQSALAVPQVEPPAVSLQQSAVQPTPKLAAPEALKVPEAAAPHTAPAPSAVASAPVGNQNATAPVPPAPYVPLPEATAGKGPVQNDAPLPLLPELNRAEPPTELPPAPTKDMALPSINPLLK
ncbi:hypothetical protein [Desulfovibrio cuneatus]|uniref:hypothetical protein n=1 Tax=Desulfovibrio cuneatus TaxID=159728 RepID=UPI0004012123|nr:hypothetical protein [Desulfovibrio cuneatus]